MTSSFKNPTPDERLAELIDNKLREIDLNCESNQHDTTDLAFSELTALRELQSRRSQAAEIEGLQAKLAAAERDARRYRWLKDNCVKHYEPPSFLLEWAGDTNDMDAAIDAAGEGEGNATGS